MSDRHSISDGLRRLRHWRRRARPNWLKSPSQLDEDGGALVEFTVMAPFFFFLLFGIIEWGSIFFLQNSMVNAAREAARAAAVQGKTPAEGNAIACKWLVGTAQTYQITTTDLCGPPPYTAANQYSDYKTQITVDADKASLINYLGIFTGVKFGGAAVFRREVACTTTGSTSGPCNCNASVNPPTGC